MASQVSRTMTIDKTKQQSMPDLVSPSAHSFKSYHSVWLAILGLYLSRVLVGLGTYSGRGSVPMYGDFEAQRHWLEITRHLDLSEWYFYDLQYWGLDYPPLTAFHSSLLGYIGSFLCPDWFALDASRGLEEHGLKVYMRQTVIVSEFLILLPSLWLYINHKHATFVNRLSDFVLIAMQPALLLVDHGHFQYNCVMLGLFVASLALLRRGKIYLGAFFFVACLSFKQMGLYYAPAIFAFLLSITLKHPSTFIVLSLTTLSTFFLFFGPFVLAGGIAGLQQVLFRMFPFGRGLFEDKVANFWCATNVLYKLKVNFNAVSLQRASLAATMLSILPASFMVFRRPTHRNLLLGSASCSWAFFLFSFQVHEKTVLLPLLPCSMLLFEVPGCRCWVGLMNIVATFSLWPLLKKDGLQLQYGIVMFLWLWLGNFWKPGQYTRSEKLSKALHYSILTSIMLAHVLEPWVVVQDKPDLWAVLNVLICAPLFGLFYVWTLIQMVDTNDALLHRRP